MGSNMVSFRHSEASNVELLPQSWPWDFEDHELMSGTHCVGLSLPHQLFGKFSFINSWTRRYSTKKPHLVERWCLAAIFVYYLFAEIGDSAQKKGPMTLRCIGENQTFTHRTFASSLWRSCGVWDSLPTFRFSRCRLILPDRWKAALSENATRLQQIWENHLTEKLQRFAPCMHEILNVCAKPSWLYMYSVALSVLFRRAQFKKKYAQSQDCLCF